MTELRNTPQNAISTAEGASCESWHNEYGGLVQLTTGRNGGDMSTSDGGVHVFFWLRPFAHTSHLRPL